MYELLSLFNTLVQAFSGAYGKDSITMDIDYEAHFNYLFHMQFCYRNTFLAQNTIGTSFTESFRVRL